MSMASTVPSSVFNAKLGDRNTFTVPEAAEILGISRWLAYESVKKGELPAIRIGRRCLISRRTLEKMLDPSGA